MSYVKKKRKCHSENLGSGQNSLLSEWMDLNIHSVILKVELQVIYLRPGSGTGPKNFSIKLHVTESDHRSGT